MPTVPHDGNFKNLFLDFPEESLEWLLPQVPETWGPVENVEFVRQEPKKHELSDRSLILDLPILFKFQKRQLLLWLVEFQEDKAKFSIYKLLRYTTDLMEAYPEATVVPAVLFTDRKKWRKSVPRHLHSKMKDRLFLHFEYVFVKLFDFKARDYYNIDNPVVKILLPKMDYPPEDRIEGDTACLRRAVSLGVSPAVRQICRFHRRLRGVSVRQSGETIYREIIEHKETAMLAQYIREKGREEGRQEGRQETQKENIVEILQMRFGKIPNEIVDRINSIEDPNALKKLLRMAVQLNRMDQDKLFS